MAPVAPAPPGATAGTDAREVARAAEAPATAPTLAGSLHEMALADVLQLLELGRKSGVLHVDGPDGPLGALRLEEGTIAAARLAARTGASASGEAAGRVRDAACTLLAARSGRFRFSATGPGSAHGGGVRLRIEAVLVEAARRADEWAALADAVPDGQAVPVLAALGGDAGRPAAPLALAPRHYALLAAVDGARDVAALARALGRDPLAVAGDLAPLVRAGLVAIARGAGDLVANASAPSSHG